MCSRLKLAFVIVCYKTAYSLALTSSFVTNETMKISSNNLLQTETDGVDPEKRFNGKPLTSIFSSGHNLRNLDPDFHKSIEYLVTSKGYPFEKHYVTTEDGYIITMHRIPHGRLTEQKKGSLPPKPNRRVALLGAPLLTESTIWVMDFPNNSFGFILADRGYDVWLTNVRGSSFGKHHTNLSVYDIKFWQYTFIDIGAKDLSAQIDYALKVTGREQVYYAGMSQGGASLYALLAKRPEYNRKLRAMAGLGTFRRSCHINIWWLNSASTLENYLGRLSIIEVMPKISMLDRACDIADKLCLWYTRTFLYTDIKYLNTVREYDFDRATVTGRWTRARYNSVVHRPPTTVPDTISSVVKPRGRGSGRFLWGVFGDAKKLNPEMYNGQTEPPILDPQNIHVPIKLYWSEGDRYAPPAEQTLLKRELRSIVAEYRITDPAWGHYSFSSSPYNASVFIDVADFFDDCSRGAEYCTFRPF
ncbi:gastric triacylglycerol lipase-like isoform X3 [Varroa jacobsoni]|uniref:gastric triacylglycerol lipase-like isoform X3 n=1 Tax=Varroa jacobsoni TaxID=62625 RepID=UPI000BF38211|nr:gastric triacylglycerol lipase-like isoform X3 [Varroa jacobsoni]